LDGRRLVDEEVVMPGGSRPAVGTVDDRRLADLIRPVAAAAGMDLESVRVTVAGRRRLLRVVVDSDHGVSLDDAAVVSREVSATLDASDVMGEVPYTLEVSSPGVDRPLTEPRHWRRAAGRLVRVKAAGEGALQGRVLAADADGVTMDVSGATRRLAYGDLGAGAVQVEFGRVPDTELEELSGAGFPDEELAEEFSDDELADDERGGELSDVELPYEADLGAGGDGH
jgi:ribosome maturation factor RimP